MSAGDPRSGRIGQDDLDARIEDFAFFDLWSFGRSAGRAFLAETEAPEAAVLSAACRLSLHPETDPEDLYRHLARFDGDPLWPALARHLARRSTDADRDLLTELARHPEKREPPLSWGLQFIVRGDLVFDGGSVVTLDELCDELGLQRLPYLEEMPDEIELPEEE